MKEVTESTSTLPFIAKPNLIFDRTAYHKIMHWVVKCPDEISGLGKVERQLDGSFIVRDVMLLPQKNTAGSTDIEAQDVCKAMWELRETPGTLNFWWHSHVNMQAFWSKTDTDTIQLLGQGGWYLATVFNKRFESKSAFFMKAKFSEDPNDSIPFFLDDIPSRVVTYLDQGLIAKWDDDYNKNVTIVKEKHTSHDREWDEYPWWSQRDGEITTRAKNLFNPDEEPTQYEIKQGFRWIVIHNEWWKEHLNADGSRKYLSKSHPSVDLDDEEELPPPVDRVGLNLLSPGNGHDEDPRTWGEQIAEYLNRD